MFYFALLSLNVLMASAQNTTLENTGLDLSSIASLNLTGCDPSVLSCFANITNLILPSGCGIPPASVMNQTVDTDTIKWAQCACPTLVPASKCLNDGLASCPALNATLGEFNPLIQSGCAFLGTDGTSTNGTSTSTNTTSTNTTSSTGETAKASAGFSAQVSLISFLAIALLL